MLVYRYPKWSEHLIIILHTPTLTQNISTFPLYHLKYSLQLCLDWSYQKNGELVSGKRVIIVWYNNKLRCMSILRLLPICMNLDGNRMECISCNNIATFLGNEPSFAINHILHPCKCNCWCHLFEWKYQLCIIPKKCSCFNGVSLLNIGTHGSWIRIEANVVF